MKRILATLAVLGSVAGFGLLGASPALAYTNAQFQTANRTVTNDCLAHAGCHAITLCAVTDGYNASFFFTYRTTWSLVGRLANVRYDGFLNYYIQSSFCGG
jgi:hypothetical protein